MAAMIYIFDTNAVSDLIWRQAHVVELVRIRQNIDVLGLCQPVDYEIERGLARKAAGIQQQYYREQIKTQFQWLRLTDDDWRLAAQW